VVARVEFIGGRSSDGQTLLYGKHYQMWPLWQSYSHVIFMGMVLFTVTCAIPWCCKKSHHFH
jgi:hypothetical protein